MAVLKPDRTHINVLTICIALLWGLFLFMEGGTLSANLLKPFALVPPALLIALQIYDRWIWKVPFLPPFMMGRPNVNGTWKGTIRSTWKDPQTGGTIPPLECYAVFRQTASKIGMRLFVKDSGSSLIFGEFLRDEHGNTMLYGIYHVMPNAAVRTADPMHFGTVRLDVSGARLHGSYWTDRLTNGDIHLDVRDRRFATSFSEAQALFLPTTAATPALVPLGME